MNFSTIIERQINYDKYAYISSRDNIDEKLLKDIPIHVEDSFIFQSKYDKNSYISLKNQFIYTIFPNQELSLYSYNQFPKETILAAYYHYIANNINQTQLFNFFTSIIKHSDPKLFLEQSVFIADYELHSLLLDTIENDNNSIFKRFLNNIFIKKITPILFKRYLDNKMFDSCELILNKYHSILDSNIVKRLIQNINIKNISHSIPLFSMLSNSKVCLHHEYSFLINSYLKDHILTYQFDLLKINKDNDSIPISLKNDLYKILNNILLKKINSNISLKLVEINLLKKIYCFIHTDLTKEQKNIIFNYFKNSDLFYKSIHLSNKFNSIFIFLALESEHFNFDSIFNNQEIIEDIFNFDYFRHFSKKQYDILKIHYGFDLIKNLFEKQIEYYTTIVIPDSYFDSIQNIELEYYYSKIAELTVKLDIDLFNSLKHDENKQIFEYVYIQTQINNF